MTIRLTVLALALVTISGLGSDAALAQPRAPLSYNGDATQVVTVEAGGAAATTADLTAWQRTPSGWRQAVGPVSAYVGAGGIGQASEQSGKTPEGAWSLTEAFGRRPHNGTRLPYRQVGTSDWWVSDTHSPLYNSYAHCDPGTCPFDESAGENLGLAGPVYDHAVVIDYNRHPVKPGAGSAFFLHISAGKPTGGCVAIPAGALDKLMAWLDPAQHPVIVIAVNAG